MTIKTLASATVLVLALGTAGAKAQASIDMGKITCDQYTSGFFEDAVVATAWFSGWTNAKKNRTTIDLKQARANVDKVMAYCTQNPKSTVMRAVRQTVR